MDTLQLARSGAEAGLIEVQDNLKILTAFKSLFVARSADLFSWQGMDGALAAELNRTLKLSAVDLGVSYAGLFVQVHSIFERYVTNYTRGVVDRLAKGATKYSDLSASFRMHHSMNSGRVLGFLADGNVNGIKFDFGGLMSNLAVCFADKDPPVLSPNVLTVSMGNCTPERLAKLFKTLGLPEPFDDQLGAHPAVKSLPGYKGGARALAKQAKDDLKASLELRNRVVHAADAAPQINASDVQGATDLVLALISAFETQATTAYPG